MLFRAIDVAQYILEYNKFDVKFTRKPINYIKLQALLYFMQYRHMENAGTVCFRDPICIDDTINAPYVEDVWRVYGKYGYNVIQVYGDKKSDFCMLTRLDGIVRAVLYNSSNLDGSEMYAIIRRSKAYQECQNYENGRKVISMDMLKEFLDNK